MVGNRYKPKCHDIDQGHKSMSDQSHQLVYSCQYLLNSMDRYLERTDRLTQTSNWGADFHTQHETDGMHCWPKQRQC